MTAAQISLLPPEVAAILRRGQRALAAKKGWAFRRQDWEEYLGLHGHDTVALGFVRIAPELDGPTYWRLLSQTWQRVEVPSAQSTLWRTLLSDSRPGHEEMMSSIEQATLGALPESVNIYRGVGHPDYACGFAWTIDRERAAWYAGYAGRACIRARVEGDIGAPSLVRGTIPREAIIAYLEGRGDAEVVALPERVTISSVVRLR